MGGCGREISPQSTARLSESAAAPAPAEADPDPSSLGLVAEISELLRLPPLPPRATLERVKALLTAARAVAAVDLDVGRLDRRVVVREHLAHAHSVHLDLDGAHRRGDIS